MDSPGCQGCGSANFRYIPEWDLLMCPLCCVALDYVTEPERQHILGCLYRGDERPADWCCWIYQPEVGHCRIHGRPGADDGWGPEKDKYRRVA